MAQWSYVVRASEETRDRIAKLATAQRRSMGSWIVLAIEGELDRQEKAEPAEVR